MYADYDMRTPALKQTGDITHTPFIKKRARLRPDVIYEPVVILHPVLLVTQDPVIQPHQLRAEVMRFFNRAHDPDRIRFAVKKLLHTRNDRGRSRTMPTARVRRNDQNLWYALLH